jgi:hypothetical protein
MGTISQKAVGWSKIPTSSLRRVGRSVSGWAEVPNILGLTAAPSPNTFGDAVGLSRDILISAFHPLR